MRSSVSWLVTPRSFILIVFLFTQNIFAAPNSLTFQAKIVKPNQVNLEEPSVSFRFRYTDAQGLCVVYEEVFTAVDMTGSKGLVSLELGAGVKTFPPAALTMYDVFNFGTALSCMGATPTPSVTPTSVERRKVLVSFNDGSGLQTLPIMNLNAVPFALHSTMANNSNQLGGLNANQYTKFTDIIAAGCVAGQALRYNGTNFVCENVTGAGAGVSSVTAAAPLASSGGSTPNVTITKADSVTSGYLASSDFTVFSSKQASGNYVTTLSGDVTSSAFAAGVVTTTLANVVTPGTSSKVTFDAKGRITSNGSLNSADISTALGYTAANANSAWSLNGSGDVSRATGNVGIGTASPASKLEVNGTIHQTSGQITSEAYDNASSISFDFNNGNVQYTSANCQPMTLTNLKNGGSYTIFVNGTTSGTCAFSGGGYTYYYSPALGLTASGSVSSFTMIRAGNNVYVTWISLYQ